MVKFVTLDALIKDLLFIIRGAKVTQSETITDSQLEAWIHQYRAVLIKQDLDKGKMPNPDYIQEIPAVKLVKVDKVGDFSNIESGELVYRTEVQIPKTIDLNYKPGILFVGTLDGLEIDMMPQVRTNWQKYKKYTGTQVVCYLKNQYIYVVGPGAVSHISIRGIFEIPSEINSMVNPSSTMPPFMKDSKYPLPVNWIAPLKQMILKTELNILTNSPSDLTNDSDLKTQSNYEGPQNQQQQNQQQ